MAWYGIGMDIGILTRPECTGYFQVLLRCIS
jgi:hypothetical protein